MELSPFFAATDQVFKAILHFFNITAKDHSLIYYLIIFGILIGILGSLAILSLNSWWTYEATRNIARPPTHDQSDSRSISPPGIEVDDVPERWAEEGRDTSAIELQPVLPNQTEAPGSHEGDYNSGHRNNNRACSSASGNQVLDYYLAL